MSSAAETQSKAIRRLLILSSACMSVVLSGCVQEPPPFSLRDMQQNERTHAREVASQPKKALPTTLESPYLDIRPDAPNPRSLDSAMTGPALDTYTIAKLPLQEIIHRTVANSLDVKVAGYTPAIDETRVTEAEARFDPVFFQNLQFQRTDQQNGIFAAGNSQALTSQTGLRQNLPSGGQAQIQLQTAYTDPGSRSSNPLNPPPETFWDSQLQLQLTQPLLRDFGNDINRARITINRNNQRISLLEFRKQLEQTISDVESAYWDLVTAEQIVRINERLLEATKAMAEILWQRRGQDVTTVQLSQANASIETRRATLIRAKANVLNISDQIKRFMNDPNLPVSSNILILPANIPSETPIKFELKDQIETALENRFELGEQQLRIDSSDVARKVAQNNLLPQLNLVGNVGIQGLEHHWDDAIEEQARVHWLNYTVGFQFEVPIGNREARAIYQRSLLQRLQAIDQYAALVTQVSLDVTKALRDIDTTWAEMGAQRQARFAQFDALQAIERRQEGGEALTPTFVQLKLDTQERVAIAAQEEAAAISNYNKAIKDLERAKGTLLRYDNVVMEEDQFPPGYRPR